MLSKENALAFRKSYLKAYPPDTEDCELIISGIRLAPLVDERECSVCHFDRQDHAMGWLFHTKVCLKDAFRHGYKPEWNAENNEEEENTMTTQDPNATQQGAVEPEGTTGTSPPTVGTTTGVPSPAPAPVLTPPPAQQPATVPPAPSTPPGPPPGSESAAEFSEEIKVIVTLRKDSALIGIQRTDTDPIFFSMSANLRPRLIGLNGFIQEAERRWAANPKYPKTDKPATAPAPTKITPPAKKAGLEKPKDGAMTNMM